MDNTYYHTNGFSPVGANVSSSVIQTHIPGSPVLYLENQDVNLLNYSGGTALLIKTPLQINDPNQTEILRSQETLVTPYNKIKYHC